MSVLADWTPVVEAGAAVASALLAVYAAAVARRANKLATEAIKVASDANAIARRDAWRATVVALFAEEFRDLVEERRCFTQACQFHNAPQPRDDYVKRLNDIRQERFDREEQLRLMGIAVNDLTAERDKMEAIWGKGLDPGDPGMDTSRRDSVLAQYRTASERYAAALTGALRRID